jgi:hypothetical protein
LDFEKAMPFRVNSLDASPSSVINFAGLKKAHPNERSARTNGYQQVLHHPDFPRWFQR